MEQIIYNLMRKDEDLDGDYVPQTAKPFSL